MTGKSEAHGTVLRLSAAPPGAKSPRDTVGPRAQGRSWQGAGPTSPLQCHEHIEHNTWQILILILTFHCWSSCLTPGPPSSCMVDTAGVWLTGCLRFLLWLRLVMFPGPQGAALMPSGVQSNPVLGQGMPAALLLLPQLPHLSGRAEAAVSSMVRPWAVPCEAGAHRLMAWPLCWIRGKHISKVGLLRRGWAGCGTGRVSCRASGCPAGQTDDV